MNLAFPAIVFLLLVLPGFLFRSAFWRSERTSFDFSPLSTAMTSVVVASCVLHFIFTVLTRKMSGWSVDYDDLLMLIAAQPGQPFQGAVGRAGEHFPLILLYFVTISISAMILGRILRVVIMRCRLDRDWWFSDLIKFDTPWYYFFDSIEIGFDGVLVTATVDTTEGTALYAGVVIDYRFDKDGVLERLVLSAASKRMLNGPDDMEDEPIRGLLVLPYTEVKALSVAPVRIQTYDEKDEDS